MATFRFGDFVAGFALCCVAQLVLGAALAALLRGLFGPSMMWGVYAAPALVFGILSAALWRRRPFVALGIAMYLTIQVLGLLAFFLVSALNPF